MIAYRESIGAAKVILQGDRLTVGADRRVHGPGVEQGRPHRAATPSGSLWIGTGSGADVFGADWSLVRALRQARRHDQRRPRSERLLRRAGRHRLARLEPRAHPVPGRDDARARAAPPIVVITNVAGRKTRPLIRHGRASLGPGERNFSVSWAGLTFIEPRQVRYRHRMVGLVDQYTETELTEARFPALPTRQVPLRGRSASSADGKVSVTPAVFPLRGPGRVVADASGREILWVLVVAAAASSRSSAGGRATSKPSAGAWRRRWRPAAPSSPRPTASCARRRSPTR